MKKETMKQALLVGAMLLTPALSFAQDCNTPEQMQLLEKLYPKQQRISRLGETRVLNGQVPSACKVWSAHPEYMIIANSWVDAKVAQEDIFETDFEVVLVDRATGTVKSRYYGEGVLPSDAVYLSSLEIDTAPYKLKADQLAFGVRVMHTGSSGPNPFNSTELNLFVPQNEKLLPLLKNLELNTSGGEWDTSCNGAFYQIESVIQVANTKTKGYFDLRLKQQQKITTNVFNTRKDECESKLRSQQVVINQLKFNGTEYRLVSQKAFGDWDQYIPK